MSQLNLDEQYSRLNREIFSNALPSDVSVKWNHSRTNMGKTKITRHRDRSYEFHITISRFFICQEKEYIETLIHEMIHVYMAQSGEFRKDGRVHGPLFKKHMNRINREFPQYTISIKEEGPVEIDQKRIKKQNGFLLCDADKTYYNLYYREIDSRIQRSVMKYLPAAFNINSGDVYFFQGEYSQLATAPVRRTTKTLIGKLQYLKDSEAMTQLKSSVLEDHIEHFPITRKSYLKSLFLP